MNSFPTVNGSILNCCSFFIFFVYGFPKFAEAVFFNCYCRLITLLPVLGLSLLYQPLSHIKHYYNIDYHSYHLKSNGLSDPIRFGVKQKRKKGEEQERKRNWWHQCCCWLIELKEDYYWTTGDIEAKLAEVIEYTKKKNWQKFERNRTEIDGETWRIWNTRIEDWVGTPRLRQPKTSMSSIAFKWRLFSTILWGYAGGYYISFWAKQAAQR